PAAPAAHAPVHASPPPTANLAPPATNNNAMILWIGVGSAGLFLLAMMAVAAAYLLGLFGG
ncbi:MAG: hypothetical protein J0L92_38735, partial [Deltaproteobacteria bacterium]|nr:hypothetical protein [Deltaproteobacteria bacterium]